MNKRFSDRFTYIAITVGIVFSYAISSLFLYLYTSSKQEILSRYSQCFSDTQQLQCMNYLIINGLMKKNEFYLIFSGINTVISALLVFIFFFIYSSCKVK